MTSTPAIGQDFSQLPPWAGFLGQLPGHSWQHGHCYFGHNSDPAEAISPQAQLGLLEITGSDLDPFLQGQLTIDVESLPRGQTVLAAHCDPKGRMHANFLLTRVSTDQIVATLPRDNIPTALAALQKYAVFSKVDIIDRSETYAAFSGPATAALAGIDDVIPVKLQAPVDALAWAPATRLEALLEQVTPEQWRDSTDWQHQRMLAGIGFVRAATSGQIIPQMLNLDMLGGISFEKGCYTGQEVIARLKYRGEVKRRCYRFSTRSGEAAELAAGQELRTSSGQSAGIIVEVLHSDAAATGLAVVKTSVAEAPAQALTSNVDGATTSLQIER